MKTVTLLGELGKKFGRTHKFAIKTAAEAVAALRANFPDFEEHVVSSSKRNVGYKVFIGNRSVKEIEELREPTSEKDRIIIAPCVAGSGAVARIIVGAVLIAVGAVLSFTPAAAASPYIIAAGVGLIIGGVVQLLTPVPRAGEPEERPENKPSYFFNGPVNTTAQGQPVPVGYGTLIVGGAVISAGITVEEIPVDE